MDLPPVEDTEELTEPDDMPNPLDMRTPCRNIDANLKPGKSSSGQTVGLEILNSKSSDRLCEMDA